MTRPLLAASFISLSLLSAQAARADGKECARAYIQGQELRQATKLERARERLLVCAQRSCPGFMQAECTRWLADVERALPTIVIDARDASGAAVEVKALWIDGERRDAPGASAMPIDPGEHTFRIEAADGASAAARAIVREGDKSRAIVITASGNSPSPPAGVALARDASPRDGAPLAARAGDDAEGSASSRGLPAGAYVLGGLAALGLASYGYFGITGLTKQLDLKSSCSPHCSEDDLSTLRRDYLAADISLGVALVAGAAFAWIALSPRGESVVVTALPPGRLGLRASF